jgi:hypothetical protein
MKIAQPEKKARPYWHIDAKWIFGTLLFFTLGAALLLFNLSKVTERDFVVEVSATVVASLFSRDGLDDEQGIEEFRQLAAQSKQDTIRPIEDFPWLTLSKEDVLKLSPRELRIKLFSQVTGPVYDKGLEEAAADFTDNEADRAEFVEQASLLGVVTEQTHQTLQKVFWIAAIVSLVFAAGLVFFSHGWGRLVSPAIVMLVVSPIGALAALLVKNPPTDGDGPLAALPEGVASEVGTTLSQSYLVVAAIAVTLLLIALIGKIVQKIIRHSGKPKTISPR